jgi:hypothetical protein
MKTIQVNTGRMYARDGQVITATLHDDGVVTFMDHSRMIDGEFQLPQHCRLNQTELMHHYDAGNYAGSRRSRTDGMRPGGCNNRKECST